MVDYVSFLARAVTTLNPNTIERRHDLYDRARKVLVDKLRAGDPTLSHTDLRAESAALEAAIHRVEIDALRGAVPPQPKPMDEAYDASAEEYQDRPPLKQLRRRPRLVAGAFGVLVILLVGAAAYSWPRIISSVRSTLIPPSVNTAAEQSAASTGYVHLRQLVYYRTNHPVGTIIVDKSQTFLYVVQPHVSALRYSIGVGPECTTLAGLYHVVRKEELPGWNPPLQQSGNASFDRTKNSIGARALYLNNDYRIHGTNETPTIGQRAPEGCIRLINDDINYLYDRTPVESRVVALN